MGGVYERIGALAGREHIHDLSGVFGTSEEPYFIDDAHITEAGDHVVAQAMLPYLLEVLKQTPLRPSGSDASARPGVSG